MARHSPANVLLHVVWSTFRRAALLAPVGDLRLRTLLGSKAEEHGCRLISVGVASDHVHVLLGVATHVPIGTVVGEMKGISSRALAMVRNGVAWGWQRGYWVESVSPDDAAPLEHYLLRQREHHDDSHPAEAWSRDVT